MTAQDWPGQEVKAWVSLNVGDPVTATDPSPSTADANEGPNAFIQWKGTDVCLDFYCPCGYQSHYDGYFAYVIECPKCEREFAMPHTVQMVEVPKG